jgi:multisubunit Na+/H+ antiporter MnhB subunit
MMLVFDIMLMGVIVWIALGSLSPRGVYKSVVMFVVFGLFMALAWVRLGAPDVALAEAAIGAGVTGVILLDAAGHLRQRTPGPIPERHVRRGVAPLPLLASVIVFFVLALLVVNLPAEADGLAPLMTAGAEDSGIKNVVTAVLLDFRGYDTLLEIAVLMLATVAVFSLRDAPDILGRRLAGNAGPLLGSFTRIVTPFMLLIAGHLIWIGSSEPGGAFQAGAVLGAAGILLALSGFASPRWAGRRVVRLSLTVGLLVFIAIALYPLFLGGMLLQYPDETRKTLILAMETWLTLSIGASLVSLFIASASPGPDGGTA